MYHFVIGVVRGADEHDACLWSERCGNSVLIRLPSDEEDARTQWRRHRKNYKVGEEAERH